MNKKLKILELTNFSAGIDGVFTRVKEEAARLNERGYEVRIFSSNLIKGTNGIAAKKDKINGVEIQRFNVKKLGGESYMAWDSKSLREAIVEYKPNFIIAHSYRHTHTIIASKLAQKTGARAFLVTHAPFGDINRGFLAKWYIKLVHDPLVGKPALKRFDKIIAITKWEIPYLLKLGVRKDKIEYIPNGIPSEFFKVKKKTERDKILFLGRVSPIKDIETLIKAVSLLKNRKIILEIVGPAEKDYLVKLESLIRNLKIGNRIVFSETIFDIKKKIEKIDSAKIFVLPSRREAMPQSLIEAMAREKIVIASDNIGARDLITDGKNGFLFKVGNSKMLAEKIDFVLTNEQNKIKKEARKSVEKFKWEFIIEKLEKLLKV